MPIFVLALVRLRVLTLDRAARGTGGSRSSLLLVFAILLPTVDPVSLAFEVIPLVLLFELSIWLSVLLERRWQRGWDDDLAAPAPVRILSADWVVPVDGPPIHDGAVAIEDDGRIAAVGPRERARRRRALPGGGDPARAS